MNRFKAILFRSVVVCLAFISSMSFAEILDFEKFRSGDAEYIERIRPLVANITQLEIGGTHFSGNNTVLKVGGQLTQELDPKILILNPNPKEHDVENPKVLSILGNGFDFHLLQELRNILVYFNKELDTVFINNVDIGLSVPDDYDLFRKTAYHGPEIAHVETEVVARHFDSVYLYATRVLDDGLPNLYGEYFSFLKQGGLFKVRHYETPDPMQSLQGLISNATHMTDNLMRQREKTLKRLQKEIGRALKKTGDTYAVPEAGKKIKIIPKQHETFTKGQIEAVILTHAGFENVEFYVGKFENHYCTAYKQKESYSMIIRARKPKGKLRGA